MKTSPQPPVKIQKLIQQALREEHTDRSMYCESSLKYGVMSAAPTSPSVMLVFLTWMPVLLNLSECVHYA